MTPTKLLIGQILIVVTIMIVGVWAGTQWAAHMLGNQPELGPEWILIGKYPVYRPWSLFPWWFHYDAYAPYVFNRAGAITAGGGFLGCAAAIAGSLWRARQLGPVTIYGSARWATRKENASAGLFNIAGLILARRPAPQHVGFSDAASPIRARRNSAVP
jgi:type IV secretion system protein VirD4